MYYIFFNLLLGTENDKLSLPSPPAPTLGFPFSRTSSTGSIDILTSSSAHNTGKKCYYLKIVFKLP